MEIAKLFNYDTLFTLDVLNPSTDEKVGITMKIRSAGSDEAKKVLRTQTNANIERRVRGKLPKSEQLEQDELEKAVSYIASWDWGTNTYEGAKPDLTVDTAIEILKAEGWIFGQVVEAANKIENFSLGTAKPSPKK